MTVERKILKRSLEPWIRIARETLVSTHRIVSIRIVHAAMIQNRMNELFDGQEAELRPDRSTLEARFLEEGGGGANPSGNWHEKLTPIVLLARVIRRLTLVDRTLKRSSRSLMSHR